MPFNKGNLGGRTASQGLVRSAGRFLGTVLPLHPGDRWGWSVDGLPGKGRRTENRTQGRVVGGREKDEGRAGTARVSPWAERVGTWEGGRLLSPGPCGTFVSCGLS